MRRRLLLVSVAVMVLGFLYFEPIALRIRILVENEGAYLSALAAAIALCIALAALALATWAIRNAYSLRSDIAQLSRALDGALHEIDERSIRHGRTIGEINEALSSEIAAMARGREDLRQDNRPQPATDRDGVGAQAENIIPHPSVRKSAAAETAASRPSSDRHEIETAIRAASGRSGPELSLQPIISVSEGKARGFDVFAHLRLSDDRCVDVRRLVSPTAGMNVAGFERGIILAAAKAARRQLGDDAAQMPLHCAVSAALLDDPDELTAVAELFDVHPPLTRSLVLSVPAQLFLAGRSGRLEMLETLSEVGIRFAVENWNGTVADARVQKNAGARYVKQPANRLLGLEKTAGNTLDTEELVEAVIEADLEIIATDVDTDEQAIGLIDSGIDLLTGMRFGEPKRLRDPSGDTTGKVIRL